MRLFYDCILFHQLATLGAPTIGGETTPCHFHGNLKSGIIIFYWITKQKFYLYKCLLKDSNKVQIKRTLNCQVIRCFWDANPLTNYRRMILHRLLSFWNCLFILKKQIWKKKIYHKIELKCEYWIYSHISIWLPLNKKTTSIIFS